MAKLAQLPSQSIIDGFKGTVDFYLWRGIACARSWPIWRPRLPHPAEQANQLVFASASRIWPTMEKNVQRAFISNRSGLRMSGRDAATAAYLGTLVTFND